MNIPLLSRPELEVINRKTLRYPLAIAEKDYMLTMALHLLYDSRLSEQLIFKGGTALHHCYLSQLRFSEDLDFTSLKQDITLHDLAEVLTSVDFFEIKKEFTSEATLKIERLKYDGPLHQPNSLKIEIDRKQNVVLPAKQIRYHNVWKQEVVVNVMDIREICAEKIRATSERARFRDFYDLYFILNEMNINLSEVVELIRHKEIRKPISVRSILANWKIAQMESTKESQLIYYKQPVSNDEIEEVLHSLSFEDIKYEV